MKEAYVTYETSKLLKEKGFDWEVNGYFCSDVDNPSRIEWSTKDYNSYKFHVSAPTQQIACRWLREVHKIFISIGVGTDIDGVFGYMPSIYFLSILSCDEGRFVPNVDADDICDSTPQTYEDAVEAALEYVLKNLI